MDILINGIGWVVLSFKDGSRRCICTTLNRDILNKAGVQPKEDYLYDLVHREFVHLREDAVDVVIMEKKPDYKKEVLNFAGRFI